jgi:hypothetical protein
MSLNSSFFAILSVVASLFIFAGQFAAGILLLREHALAAWLMLLGTAMTSIARLVFMVPSLLALSAAKMYSGEFYFIIPALNIFGSMSFIAGLLIFAMQRRLLSDRIKELEAILADRTGSP